MNSNQGKSRNIFYGWWIVAAAIVCQFVSVSVGQGIVGIFLNPVTADLGWPVWQYTLGPSLALGVGAVSGIYWGQLVDQQGPRRLVQIGAIVCAVSFLGMAWQSHLWLYWLLNILVGFMGWNLFGPLIIGSTLSKWFVQKRGWALTIGSIGVPLGNIITPITMTRIVDSGGWRMGYTVVAIFVLLVVLPIALVMRRMPEDMGLLPDGEEMNESQNKNDSVPGTHQLPLTGLSLTRAEALRTPGFWLLAVGFAFIFSAIMSVLIHAIPFATAAGFTRATAAIALTINGFGNLASKAVWGFTLQRFHPRLLVLAAYTLSALGVAMMLAAAWSGTVWFLYGGFLIYGFGFGGTIPLSEFIWAKYFGRTHIGAIRGVGQLVTILGPTVVPVLVGLWFDVAGTYQPAFLMVIGLYLVGATMILVSREPNVQANV